MIAIPRAAVRKDGDRDIVFVVHADGRVERRAIRGSPPAPAILAMTRW